jgi:hypothetical protein
MENRVVEQLKIKIGEQIGRKSTKIYYNFVKNCALNRINIIYTVKTHWIFKISWCKK